MWRSGHKVGSLAAEILVHTSRQRLDRVPSVDQVGQRQRAVKRLPIEGTASASTPSPPLVTSRAYCDFHRGREIPDFSSTVYFAQSVSVLLSHSAASVLRFLYVGN